MLPFPAMQRHGLPYYGEACLKLIPCILTSCTVEPAAGHVYMTSFSGLHMLYGFIKTEY